MTPFLRYSADWRSVVVIVLTVTAAFTAWSGIYHAWWQQIALWCISTGLMYVCFAVNHNHQHLHISRWRWGNHALDLALSLCQGLPAPVVVYAHNIDHHTHADSPQDAMWTGHVRARNHLLRLLLYPLVSAARYAGIRRTVAQRVGQRNPAFVRRIAVLRWLLITITGVLLVCDPLATVAVFIVPWMLVHLWGVNSNFMQHEGCAYDHPHDHSRNFLGPVMNWVLFNGGYHTIHHERPGLHWSRMPQEHARRAAAISPHLNVRCWGIWILLYVFCPQRALHGAPR